MKALKWKKGRFLGEPIWRARLGPVEASVHQDTMARGRSWNASADAYGPDGLRASDGIGPAFGTREEAQRAALERGQALLRWLAAVSHGRLQLSPLSSRPPRMGRRAAGGAEPATSSGR